MAPNGRRATFFNVWAGRRRRAAFRRRLHGDLTSVFEALGTGAITARVAARYPLDRAAEAMAHAESRTAVGKVVLVPNAA